MRAGVRRAVGGLVRFGSAAWLDAARVAERHRAQFVPRLGRFGYPFHVVLAMVFCAGVAGPMAAVELAGLVAAGCFVLRLPFVSRGLRDAMLQPALLVLVLWVAWVWVQLWRGGLGEAGLHEASYQRWSYAFLVLWAVMDRRRWLIAAMCVGFALAQLAQGFEWIGHRWGVEKLVWSHPPAPDPAARISGWWHQPAVGGSMLVACLGLHLGPAILGAGRKRWIASGACVATLAGLLLTGTRGAWIAAIVLVGCVVIAALGLRARAGESRRLVGVVSIAGVLMLGGVFVLDGPRARVMAMAGDVRAAWTRGDLDSDVGGRILAARAALDAVATNPIAGIGPGNFNAHVRTFAAREGIAVAPHRFDHLKTAHNALLHTLATQGIIGAALLCAGVTCAVFAGLRPRLASGVPRLREYLGTYGASPAVALVGLTLASAFDTITLNASTGALFTVLVALCVATPPAESRRSLMNLADSSSDGAP
jgi:O-antigen ligase